MSNLYELFDSTCARFGERTAVELQRADGLDVFSYEDLRRIATDTASRLHSQGCRKGDRVALLAENDARWCAAFLGILRLGALAVPLDTAYTPPQVARLLADCGASHMIAGPRQLSAAREAVLLGAGSVKLLAREGHAAAAVGSPWLSEDPATAEEPAVILYTSGTTADPKGVVLTHANLMAEREAAFRILEVGERDVVLSVLPLFHALALLANLLLPLSVGARVVFLESVNSSELLRALRDRGISAFCCVPQFFYLIHQRVMSEVATAGLLTRGLFRGLLTLNGWLRRNARINLGRRLFFRRVHAMLGPRMRLLVTGGSRFDPAVGRDLVGLGFEILQAYGLTECSGAATVTRPDDPQIESVGIPLPGVEVKIGTRRSTVEGVGTPASDGEILIRGPIVMSGYYNRPDANATTIRDGWLHTGDLGFVDARGRLHVTGRSKEVIVLASGKNIYPEEIEAHYIRSPFIKELCVFGASRPDQPAEPRLHAVVVPDLEMMRRRKIVNMREQLRFEIEGLSVELPSHKRILGYEVSVEELPRTTTRKLKRFEIERRLSTRQAQGGDAAPIEPTTEERIWRDDPHVTRMLAALCELLGRPGPPPADANLELDLGLDSMERIELLTGLEHAAGVRLSEESTQRIYTVRELIESLRTATASAGPGRQSAPAWEQLLRDLPGDDPTLTGLLAPRRLLVPLLYLVTRAMYAVARLSTGFRVEGVDALPERGPFILSPNHQSFLDAFLLVSALPYRVFRRLFFVGASEYFSTPLAAWVARKINVVPVDPDSNLVKAMQGGAYGLRHEKVLILFPEGERSIDGAVKTFKKGAAILSLHVGVPIVPIAMDGVFDVWPRNRPPRWRSLLPGGKTRILMRIGRPLYPQSSTVAEEQYLATTERLRDSVERMWSGLRERREASG